jgi:alpha-glucosidase (family GH31 glycosyl hydrolase)
MSAGQALLFAVGDAEMAPLGEGDVLRLAAGEAVRFDLASGGHWYGHGFGHDQPYPLESGEVVNENFAVNNIQSPIWMCSAGVAVLAETTEPLSVRLNAGGNGVLEVTCPCAPLELRFFRGPDLPAAQRALMSHLGWPNRGVDERLLRETVFCTWTQFPRCITRERVLGMAREIREQGYPCSTLTVDDRWESAYGELEFSPDFPDPAGMVRELHATGFRVLLWVTPFVNREAATFETLAARGLLVSSRGGGPAMLKWWGGDAGLVDLTRPAAREWYRDQLLRLRNEVGVDGFKIDGGDAKYQPDPAGAVWAAPRGASGYVDELLAVFEEVAPGICETRTAWLSQPRRILWRQGGKDSHWGADNGLSALVRLALNMSLMGYDVLMPDMIPGRVQTMASDMPLPSDELMVRWTEASAFLPAMQFSYYPWNYAEETAAAVRGLALVHAALGDHLVRHSRERRAPLVRPVWYEHPEVPELYAVDDQFLLGPDVLVAPVLEEGADARDVVLPPGSWRDAWTGETHSGRLERFPAPCPGAPVFVRAGSEELFRALDAALSGIERGSVSFGVTTASYSSGIDRDLDVSG